MRCSADIYRRYLFIFCVRPCGPGIERRSARQLQNHPWLEIHASNVLGRTIIFPRLSPTQRSPDTFVDFCFFFSFFASTTRQFQLITECLPIKEAGLCRCPWKLFFPFLFFFFTIDGSEQSDANPPESRRSYFDVPLILSFNAAPIPLGLSVHVA